MKKFFVAALALVCSSTAFAIDYEPEEGLTTQIFAGMSASKITGFEDLDGKIGGTAGIKFEYMLPNAHGTYINAGLDWVMKGGQKTLSVTYPGIGTVDATTSIPTHYVELPIHLGYRYNILPDLGVYADFGPYFSFGVTGNCKYSLDADGSQVAQYENSYAIFKKSENRTNFQRWDAGFGFRVGCEYDNRYSLNLGCDWGFTDMWRDSFRDAMHDSGISLDKIHNFNFTLAFGYRF